MRRFEMVTMTENGRITVEINALDLNNYMEILRSLARIIVSKDRDLMHEYDETVENVAYLLVDMIPTGDEINEIVKSGM